MSLFKSYVVSTMTSDRIKSFNVDEKINGIVDNFVKKGYLVSDVRIIPLETCKLGKFDSAYKEQVMKALVMVIYDETR